MASLTVVGDELLIHLNHLERVASPGHHDMSMPLADITSVQVSDRPVHDIGPELDVGNWVQQPPSHVGTVEWYRLYDQGGRCFISYSPLSPRAVIVRCDGSQIAVAVVSQHDPESVAATIQQAVDARKSAKTDHPSADQ